MQPDQRITVLIVEDDAGIADLEQLQLERAGFGVLVAGTPEEALERLRRQRVHLVLLDYRLPGDVDGLDFHAQMKETGFDLPVILVTGFSNEALAIRALRGGVRDFVTKSTEYIDYLPEAVHRVLKQVDTEAALAAERKLLRTLIDAMPDVVFTKDTAGRFVVCNAAGLHLVGLAREEELADKTDFDLFPRALAELYHADDLQVLAGQAVYDHEEPRADASGKPRWQSTVKVPLRDGSGAITGLVGISRDISERKRTDEILAERARLAALSAEVGLALTTTERLEDALERCADAVVRNLDGAFARIWTFNETEKVLELRASAGMYTHLDGPHSRVPLGQFKIGLIAQERRPHLTNDVPTDARISDPDWARREGMIAFAGYPLILEDRLVGVMAMFARHPLAQATLDAMAAVAVQIALGIRRKQTEESRNLFRELLDRSNDAIEVIDSGTGHFLDANEKAWLSLGYSREEFLSLRVADIDPEVASISWSERMAAIQRSGFLVLEAEHRRKDGSLFSVEVNAKSVRLNGEYFVAVVRDITERKRAERRMLAQHAVTRILAASPSLADAGVQILQALCQSMAWKWGELWCVDGAVQVLRCRHIWQQPSTQSHLLQAVTGELTCAPGIGLPGKVWASRQVLWMPDVVQDAGFLRTASVVRAGFRGAVGFPLTLGGEVLGVLVFISDAVAQPDDDLIKMMAAVGSQIGQFMERKRGEEELGKSEERFRQIAENIREVFWLTDPEGQSRLYVSPAYETVWGQSCASLYAAPDSWLHAIHPEERERVRMAFGTQAISGPYDEVYRIVRADGAIRWVHDRGFPVQDATGKVYRIAGVAEDITERRGAEAASLQQKLRLEGIVNSAMDGIITIDEDQRILLINAAAERMFGCKAQDVLGQSVELLLPQRFRARHADYVREFGRTGVAARTMGMFGPISGLRQGGEEFPIEASISQLEMDGRKLFTVTCRDITERVAAQATKQKLEAQLHQSQKMEAFGQLAGGIAHDFNNLLTVILGYSEILLTGLPATDPKRESVKAIFEAGSRANSLTRQLLAFSRKAVLELKNLDLNCVVRDTEKILRRLIGEDILLSTLLDPSICQVEADVGLMGQVLINLAVNSRDAMPQGGKLSIETGNVELTADFPNAPPDFRPGHYVVLAVTDTGSGMTPEVKARIFEPFFTTKDIGKGTGLGLSVVHGIVNQSGGLMELESELGRGTTFKIYLPAVERRPTVAPAVGPLKEPRGKETILLVEDEENVRGLVSLALRSYGYHVLIAADGKDALRVVGTHPGDIDLLLTDVVMPHMSGRELVEVLRPQFPWMRVLYMSGYTDEAVLRHGLVRGEVPFLQKPTTPLKLAAKVRSVLDSPR